LQINLSYSLISIESIKEILFINFNFYDITYCELFQSSSSDIYKIVNKGNIYYFKVYFANSKIYKDLEFEIEVMNKLKQYNISCYLIESDKNSYIIKLNCIEGLRYAILLSNSEGIELNYNIHQSAIIYGKYQAILHKNLDNLSIGQYKEFNLFDTISKSSNKIIDFLNQKDKERNFFIKIKEQIILNLKNISLDKFEFGICHNDLHGGNSSIDQYNSLRFYDFDFCSYNYRIYDLAVFYWSCLNRKNEKQWNSFIHSYKMIKNINLDELKYINNFIVIRDLIVISLYIDKTKKLGSSFFNDIFLYNRINFLKNLKLT
jgi:Ser/Thr protein kinase RdoA (MazF antagonist)